MMFLCSEESCAKLPCRVSLRQRNDTPCQACLLHSWQILHQAGGVLEKVSHCQGVCHRVHVLPTPVGDGGAPHIHPGGPWARLPPPSRHHAPWTVTSSLWMPRTLLPPLCILLSLFTSAFIFSIYLYTSLVNIASLNCYSWVCWDNNGYTYMIL